MNIQTFSQTYWYIWFLLILLIVMLAILNGVGILFYRKKRQLFLQRSNRINNNIPMSEISSVSTMNMNKSRYRQMSMPSPIGTNSSSTNRSSYIINPEKTIISIPNMTTIPETLEISDVESISPSIQINERSDMDLELEEFQRQALKEHNAMRLMYNKIPLKLSESLNIYAQYWAEHCAKMNTVIPSGFEWRLQCKGQTLGENIVSVNSTNDFDGSYFTLLIMANGNQSSEVDCVLNDISTEVGFGRAQSQPNNPNQQQQWIGVAHYYPYHQLTTVQS